MVVFNPQVAPTNDPNFTNISRPISDLVADKSKAVAISGATDLLNSGVKLADTLTKQSIDTDTREGVETLRDAYTDSLKAIRNVQLASADPTNSQANATLLPNDGAAPPPGLQNGLNRVQQLGTALAQNGGGKINDTLYTGALNSLAKQLRNSYPGYKDYIDDKIKSVSGVDPANAFMRNLMEDINRNVEEGKTERNATRTMLRGGVAEGFKDVNGVTAAQMLEGYDKGIFDTHQVNKWYNQARTLEYTLKTKAAARADRQADDVDAAKLTTKDLSTVTGQIIDQAWTTMTIGKNTDTPAKLFDYIQKNAGNPNVTDERSQAIGQQLGAMRTAMFNQAWAEATKGGANSMIAKMGGDAEAAKKVIEGRLATMDLAIKSVYDNQWGAAYSHMNMNKAIANDSTNLMYNAPNEEVRRYNRMVGAVNQISPQAASQFFKNSLVGNVPQAEKEFLKNTKLELLVQPDQEMGSLISANGQLQKMKAKGATSPKTYSDFIDTVGLITDKNWSLENRINLARGFFDPEKNAGLLSDKNFKKDQTVNGRYIPGKYSVFTKLSSPDVAKSIAELGNTRPDIAKDYDVMMSREFGEQLFSREIKDLGQENLDTSIPRGYKIAYVSDKGQVPRFEIVDLDNRPLSDTQALALRAPVSAKNRLNTGITGMYTVYANTGHADPSVSVLNTMYRYGYQDAANVQSPQGPTGAVSDLPKMLWNSLVSAQQDRLRKAGEAMKKAKE
jgi:hypothetical protein